MAAKRGIWLYHGGEAYLVDRNFWAKWHELTSDLMSDVDHELLEASASPDDVRAAITAVGFFSTGRAVGIRDWNQLAPSAGGRRSKSKTKSEDPAEAAVTAVDQLPEGAHLVLAVHATVPKGHPLLELALAEGNVYTYPTLRLGELPGWVQQRARELGTRIDPMGVRLLVDSVGDDLQLLDAELEKLRTYAGDGTIDVAAVRALVPDTAEHQVWDLTDALLVDPGKAARELDRAIAAGEPVPRLSYMLVRHLRLVLAASDAPSGPPGVVALTKAFAGEPRPLSEYSIKKALGQAETADKRHVEALYKRAAEVEAASRRGEIEDETALRLLVLSAARSA